MLFKHAFHPAIAAGTITTTYRAWSSARVKVGNTYRLNAEGVVAVDEVMETLAAKITDTEAQACGFASRNELLGQLFRPGRGDPEATVFRIRFHYRSAARDAMADVSANVSTQQLHELIVRLQKMDARSRAGPWTGATLALIHANPQVAASRLAPQLHMETPQFKGNVCKLKELGLTISYETGYAVTSLGARVLREGAPWQAKSAS